MGATPAQGVDTARKVVEMATDTALEDWIVGSTNEPSPERTRVEACPRWVRVFLEGVAIADSKHVLTVFHAGRMPIYYFPVGDVRPGVLDLAAGSSNGHQGGRQFFDLNVGDRHVANAGWTFPSPPADAPELADHVAFYWNRVDHWYEEDDEVFVHARDPHHRVDVLNSSRHVRIVAGGAVIADSRRPRLLFETGLPTRYYLPRLDVRMDLLGPSETVTQCPYKGKTVHFDLAAPGGQIHDVAWSYPFPIPECPKIENLICFYDERVDSVEVDGEVQPKPTTPWS